MRVLYAVQGTGNGHIARAGHIVPLLKQRAEVDVLISGFESDIELGFPVRYRFKGLSFVFGKSGGIDFYQTFKKNKLRRFYKEIDKVPVENYDLVISDFEPLSAWACQAKGKPCIGLSNQCAVLSPDAPKAKFDDPIGLFVLKRYAPVSSCYGFHFQSYNDQISTPIIRQEVQDLKTKNRGHYTVYLPSYSDKKIAKVLSQFTEMDWHIYSKHTRTRYRQDNLRFSPISQRSFLKSMAGAEGVLCAAGFTTPSEAMYLRKKLLVIPQKNQYEQQCNAAALKDMGVPVIKSLKLKHSDKIRDWLDSNVKVLVNYEDKTAQLLDRIFSEHLLSTPSRELIGPPAMRLTY